MTITKEEAKEIIFNKFKSSPTLPLQADIASAFPETPQLNENKNMDKILEVCSELLADKIVYQSNGQHTTIYSLTEKGKEIMTEKWTNTTSTEKFLSELKKENLLFDKQLEDLIFEFNQAYESKLYYSANLVLTLASEKALDKITKLKQTQFGNKLIEVEDNFKKFNKAENLNLTQRKILNYAHQMHEYRNSYAHLNYIKFDFIQERQNFVNYLKNINQLTL